MCVLACHGNVLHRFEGAVIAGKKPADVLRLPAAQGYPEAASIDVSSNEDAAEAGIQVVATGIAWC
jgi:hypothetical protein